jgi:hypothetical protein
VDASLSVPGSQCLDVVQTNGQNPGSSCAPPVSGPKLWAWVIPRGLWLRRVVFYSAYGHKIAVQSGAEYPPRG